MKEEKDIMSGVTLSPFAASSGAAPTPSPLSFSVTSTRWSSRSPFQTANLLLRFLSLVFSFTAALSLIALSSTTVKLEKYPELLYLFTANILTAVYATYQLFKSICDIAHRGILISDMVSDYISFVLDQLAGYLLVSASSVAVPVVQQMYSGNSFWKAAVVSLFMSFASFLVTAATAHLSGYKLFELVRETCGS